MVHAPLSGTGLSLRYVSDAEPGFRRRRCKQRFAYIDTDGHRVVEKSVLERIRALAIPPAWESVWICKDSCGHIQATGRDARGRKQYRYHPLWIAYRNNTKFETLVRFGERLPLLRRRLEADLSARGLGREKLIALVVRLLDTLRIRIGNREYARVNESFGLTTLQTKHVQIRGECVRFKFKGKSGKLHLTSECDPQLTRIIRRVQELPGQELFQYRDEEGDFYPVGSSDVNRYLHETMGSDFSAKDFRTWAGTVEALSLLLEKAVEGRSGSHREVSEVVKAVATTLGNTPAVCRKYYIHPAVIEAFEDGTLLRSLGTGGLENRPGELSKDEARTLTFLNKG